MQAPLRPREPHLKCSYWARAAHTVARSRFFRSTEFCCAICCCRSWVAWTLLWILELYKNFFFCNTGVTTSQQRDWLLAQFNRWLPTRHLISAEDTKWWQEISFLDDQQRGPKLWGSSQIFYWLAGSSRCHWVFLPTFTSWSSTFIQLLTVPILWWACTETFLVETFWQYLQQAWTSFVQPNPPVLINCVKCHLTRSQTPTTSAIYLNSGDKAFTTLSFWTCSVPAKR